MGFNFPNTPTSGQTYTPAGGPTFSWDGVAWKSLTSGVPVTVYVSDAPPVSPAPGQLYWESDTGNLYIWYADGDSAQWVQVNGTPGGYQTAETRNRIVNGAMQISQENGQTAGGATLFFPADQWYISSVHGGVHSAVNLLNGLPASRYSAVKITATTIDAAVAAGDMLGLFQRIEGLNIVDFWWGNPAALPAMLRFTAWANNAGTYSVSLRDTAASVSFVSTFTLAASTWTDIVIAVPAPTIGTFATTNTQGANIGFGLLVGSTYQAPVLNQWVSGDYRGHASQTNFMATLNNDFRVTNVGLYLDPLATGVAPPWAMPDEAEELQACKRYYEKYASFVGGYAPASIIVYGSENYMTKRIAPAVSFSNITYGNATGLTNNGATVSSGSIWMTSSAATAVWAAFYYHLNARM